LTNPHHLIDRLIEVVAATMGVTRDEAERRRRYLGLSDDEAALLREVRPTIATHHDALMRDFYAHLQSFDETRELLQDPASLERLKRKQWRYLAELTTGRYDWDYVIERLRVGVVHQSIGLEPRWYIGAYSHYLSSLADHLATSLGEDPERLVAVLVALQRVVFFDISLVLEAYFHADRQALLSLKDLSDRILASVPVGLLVLADDLTIVSANGFMERLVAEADEDLVGARLEDVLPQVEVVARARQALADGLEHQDVLVEQFNRGGARVSMQVRIVPLSPSVPEPGVGEGGQGLATARLLVVVEDLSEYRRLRQDSREASVHVRAILDNVADGIITIDDSGVVESFNPAAERLFGYSTEDVIGRNVRMLMPEPYRSGHDGYLARHVESGERRCLGVGFREVEGLRRDGSVFAMELSISEMRLDKGRRFIGIVRDITERRAAQLTTAKLSSAVEQAADSIIITDDQGVIEYVNGGFEETTGYSREDALGRTPGLVKSGMHDAAFYSKLWSTIQSGNVFRDVFVNRRRDGGLYYEEKTITPLRDPQGNITHFVSSGKDITERIQTQERLQHLAQHDMLTGLPNRALLMDRLSQAMAWDKRHGGGVALLFLDLDRFKLLNDSMGHDRGDRLLQWLAARLRVCVREGDTVARLSGDEFALVLQDIVSVDEVLPVARKVLECIADPLDLDGVEVAPTASIGIALFPDDGVEPNELLRQAEIAMYRAKAEGRGGCQFYTSDMNTAAEQRFLLENDLRRALERDEFVLHYQPQVLIDSGETIGVEALLRWNHPIQGLVPPAAFIPILEESGLIRAVGQWVLDTACGELRRMRAKGLVLPRMAVNISPRQLADPEFAAAVGEVLTRHALSPGSLELEITETSLMEDEGNAVESLHLLEAIGVHLAMDDFGTGYSSLSYLRRLPVDTLKIDRAFVANVPEDGGDCELAGAIVALGHSLKLRIVAEGVETGEQLTFLRAQGCDAVQGYFVARPMPADALAVFLHPQA